jgi:prepilin-type N-terminal cleavage/methylation domain-containing protein
MNFQKMLSQKGFSLTEIMVATGLMGLVTLGAFQTYNYFNKETHKEILKMGDLTEFNQLTRDLLKFSEGAGVSTVYLNLPYKTKNCDANKGEPCLMILKDGKFVPADSSEVPDTITKKTCAQFFKESAGTLSGRRAYSGKGSTDTLMELEDMQVRLPSDKELMATWPLIDEKSTPFLLMKMREGGMYMNMLKKPTEISRSSNMSNRKVPYSFFEYEVSPDDPKLSINNVKKMQGYPFLIYNSFLPAHFTVQYAHDIISCRERRSDCLAIIGQINPSVSSDATDESLTNDFSTKFPDNVFAIEYRPLDFEKPFFSKIIENQRLPSECYSVWDPLKQDPKNYFFPSAAYSVYQLNPSSISDLAGSEPLNVLHLNHYYTGVNLTGMGTAINKGVMVALPLDIISYKVEKNANGKDLSLVSELWHATEIKKKTKIEKLKGPFMMTRKLGSSELGLWYNPLMKSEGVSQ